MNTCGFIVVRKPSENYYPRGNGVWPKRPPQLGSVYYGGAWRMPWCDINFDIHNGKLPMELRDLYQTNVTDPQGSGFSLCKDLAIANKLLTYCNRDQPRCEIIAIYSPQLAFMKGTTNLAEAFFKNLGWDLFQIGGGSLLENGIFAKPNLFPAWHEKLNDDGLLISSNESLQYVLQYKQLVEAQLLEEIFPTDNNPIDQIQIMSVKPH